MFENQTGYSFLQILLHWLIAALVLFQLIFGEDMTMFVYATEEGTPLSHGQQTMGSAHYWIGIAVLALATIRLIVRFAQGAPSAPSDSPSWMQRAAKASHGLFYILLLATPILGLLAFYIGDPWGDIHSLAKPVFIVLIAAHALAAIVHQFFLKDGTLMRMLRPRSI